MSRPFSQLLCCLVFLFPALSGAAPRPVDDPEISARPTTIAVADFSGDDPELGRFLADTLLTDLGQSTQLHLVERTEIRRALEELKLQSTGLFAPEEVQALGRMVRADGLIVGSYYVHDNLLIVNARLLDVKNGRLAPGGSANVSGDNHHLLSVVHRLTHLFHRRLTGSELVLDGEGAELAASSPGRSRQTNASGRPVPTREPSGSSASGYHVGQGEGDPPKPPAPPRQTESDTRAPDNRTRESALSQNTFSSASPSLQDTRLYIESVRASLGASIRYPVISTPPIAPVSPFRVVSIRMGRSVSLPRRDVRRRNQPVFRLELARSFSEKYTYRCR